MIFARKSPKYFFNDMVRVLPKYAAKFYYKYLQNQFGAAGQEQLIGLQYANRQVGLCQQFLLLFYCNF